jgi:PAS domain S-box-containing protein
MLNLETLEEFLSKENKVKGNLFESNQMIVFLFTSSGKILYANPTLLDQMDLSFKTLKSKSIFDFFSTKRSKRISTVTQKFKKGKTVDNFDLKVKEVDKGNYHFEIDSFPIDEKGTIIFVLSIICDITRRNGIKRKLKELSDITKHSADSTIKTDTQFRITYMNPAAEKLYGWKLEEVRGKTPAIFNAEENVKGFQNIIYKTVTSGHVYEGTYLNKRKDGTKFHCEMRISPLFDESGNIYAFTSSQRDVTQRIKTEKRLKKALIKSDFYKDLLAHDMGNILNNIKSSIQLLEITDPNNQLSKEKREVMAIVKQQVKRAASLISNVRKLSEIDEVDFSLKPVNIKILIKRALNDIISRFQEKDLKINLNIPQDQIKVKGGNLLLDVFENILINSCIHNDSEMIQIWVEVFKIQSEGEKLMKLEFKDNGIGICDERKETIFDRNFNKEKSRGGMGLGLSLVKKIIEEYGGQIRVENRVKEDYSFGSNFILLLESAESK